MHPKIGYNISSLFLSWLNWWIFYRRYPQRKNSWVLIFWCFFLVGDVIAARSISEEFSSGDATRFRDEEYTSKPEGACTSGGHPRAESAHKSDKDKERRDKEKEDKDEGENLNSVKRLLFLLFNPCFCLFSLCRNYQSVWWKFLTATTNIPSNYNFTNMYFRSITNNSTSCIPHCTKS